MYKIKIENLETDEVLEEALSDCIFCVFHSVTNNSVVIFDRTGTAKKATTDVVLTGVEFGAKAIRELRLD